MPRDLAGPREILRKFDCSVRTGLTALNVAVGCVLFHIRRQQGSGRIRFCCFYLAADGEDGDVVLLAKRFGGVSQEDGGLLAEQADAVESEELAVGMSGLDDSVREQENAVSRM